MSIDSADEGFIDAVVESVYAVEGRHHVHGHTCLCGFSSFVSRVRTGHIVRAFVAEMFGSDVADEVNRRLPQ